MERISIAAMIRKNAKERPDDEICWIIHADGRETCFTAADLDRRSDQLAGALRSRGLGPGDRQGIALPNGAAFVISAFAAWKLGAVPIPMRWDLPEWEMERLAEVVDAKVQLTTEDEAWIEGTRHDPVPKLPEVVSPHLNGICSSGSTGLPKVVVAGQPAYFDPIYIAPFVEYWGVSVPRPQHVIVLGPMYHLNGFTGLNFLIGGDRVFIMERFDAARVVDVIERHRISTFNCTPTMLKRIADLPDIDDRDLSSIEWFNQGGAPMPPYLVHRWAELVGAEKIVMAYGMTETIGLTAVRGDEYLSREGTVGRPFRGTEIRILDEHQKEVATGEIGDVYMRSAFDTGALYLGQAPQMRRTEDGFATVGDMGYVDADGYLYLVDRRVDMIISGGANVFPAEVEIALMEHPDVADVVVIGLKDEEWGRRVHAIIEPRDPDSPPSLEEIRSYAKQRVAAYKAPRSIEIVATMPRSAATKVNRGRLIEERGG